MPEDPRAGQAPPQFNYEILKQVLAIKIGMQVIEAAEMEAALLTERQLAAQGPAEVQGEKIVVSATPRSRPSPTRKTAPRRKR